MSIYRPRSQRKNCDYEGVFVKKVISILFVIVSLLLFVVGCKSEDANVVGETSHGTPIVELESYDDIPWETPKDSDCFNAIAYDKDKHILYVSFDRNDAKYRYLDFPEDEWRWFKKADSLGSYYNKHIKGQYTCQKISE